MCAEHAGEVVGVGKSQFLRYLGDAHRGAFQQILGCPHNLRLNVFVRRDVQLDDGKAYHIYASEENLTLHIAELSNDYRWHTGRFVRVAAGGMNEAPALFKHDGTYWMITSGCTGWAPNEARLFSAKRIWGPWIQHPTPCVGPDAEITFKGQSTYILPVAGRRDAYIFMADSWRPEHPSDGRYIWLPIRFSPDGTPVIEWKPAWNLNYFDKLSVERQ